MPAYTTLSAQEISAALATLPEWKAQSDELVAEYALRDFRSAMLLINMIAAQAEVMNHHPSWSNTYNRVAFRLSTHDAGGKVTNLDIAMAEYINKISKQFI